MRGAFLLSALTLLSCGLDAGGLAPANDLAENDGGPSDALSSEGATLDGATLDGAIADGGPRDARTSDAKFCVPDGSAAATDCFALPSGWKVIAFLGAQTSSCRGGFASVDLVEGPAAGPSACACGSPSVTTPPSCTGGSIAYSYDTNGGGGCGTAGDPTKLSNNPAGQCLTDLQPGTRPANLDLSLVPPLPQGGNCTSPAVVRKDNVTFASRDRACVPADPASIGCVGSACAPNVAAPFRACLMTSGIQNCSAPSPRVTWWART